MKIKQLQDNEEDKSGFELVEIADDTNIGCKTPHCKNHRAMNVITDGNGRRIWRCFSEYSSELKEGNTKPTFRDRTCPACCIEITH